VSEVRTPGEVELCQWRPWWPVLVGIVGIVAAITALLASVALGGPGGATGRFHYELWRWEANQGVNALLQVAGFGPRPSDAEAQQAITRYFALTSQLREEESKPSPDANLVAQLTTQRDKDAPTIARWLEQVDTEAYGKAGVKQRLPLFGAISMLWPPLKVDLTQPVHVLVRSPRDHIARLNDTVLVPDLTVADAEQIEKENDSSDVVSLVVSLGGIATYPSMVRDDRSYDDVLFTSAHEWVHQYLAFYPLGFAWNTTEDAVILNETAADIVAPAIAAMVQQAHPIHLPPGADGNPPPGPPPDIDFNQEMHTLRLQVDQLLADGKVSEAESLMEEKRQVFVAHGFYIRKLNQAYFAFNGTYGDYAQSSNPIGGELEQLWQQNPSPGAFLQAVRGITSRAQLEATLASHH
jgi:hypothetical protein